MTAAAMDAAAVAHAIGEFRGGRITFDRLAGDLAEGAASPDIVAEVVGDFVNTGRLPEDIGQLLVRHVAAAAERRLAARAPDPGAALRGRVEEVVTSALVADFRRFRDRPARANRVAERQLDVLLDEFRGLRLRRQAHDVARDRPGAGDLAGLRAPGPSAVETVPPLAPGAMLNERFVLDHELGRGGMGQVFRAVDRRRLEVLDPQPFVAVKLLAGDFRRHPDALRAIEAEARKAQLLAHPNICTVFDFDRDGPHAFIVMELLEGVTLRKAIAHAADGRLPPVTIRFALADILAGLAYAHSRAVVHADVKPDNVMLTRAGPAKLLDFGVAAALGARGFDPTALRAVSPGFSSPELASGSAERDPRDDVFSAAALAYLLVAGRHPFDGLPADQAAALAIRPAPIAGADTALSEVLLRALSFRREDRPADAGALAEILLPALAAPFEG